MRRIVQRGFTLIEVMIVVAVVAILAAVALPSYVDYLRRGQLPEAFTYLSDYRIKLEQYYQDNRNYGSGAADSNCANAPTTPSWNDFVPTGRKYFDFNCKLAGGDGQNYLLTATGVSSTRAAGHVYTLNAAGLKRTTQLKGATVNKTCWAVKESDC